jgi:hypothetical protein
MLQAINVDEFTCVFQYASKVEELEKEVIETKRDVSFHFQSIF